MPLKQGRGSGAGTRCFEPEPIEKKTGAGAGAAWKKLGAGAGAAKKLACSSAL